MNKDGDFSSNPSLEVFDDKIQTTIGGGIVAQEIDFSTALNAQKDLYAIQKDRFLLSQQMQNDKDLQDENIKQRNKLIGFFLWLISAQFLSVVIIVVLCIHLMSRNLLARYEYDWVLSVLRIYFVVISIEVLSLFGIVVFRYFGGNKVKK